MTGVCSPNYSSGTKRNTMVCRDFVTFGVGYRNCDLPADGRNSCVDRLELVPMTELDMRWNQYLGSTPQRELETGLVTSMVADSAAHKVNRLTEGQNLWPGKKSDLIVSKSRNRPQNTTYVTELVTEPIGTSTQLLLQPFSSHLVTTRCSNGEFVQSRVCRRNAMQGIGERLRQEASETNLQRGSSGSKSCPNLRTPGHNFVDGNATESFLRFVRRADDLSWNGHALLELNRASSVLRKDPMDYGHYRKHRCKLSRSSVDAEGSSSIRCFDDQYTLGKTDPYETIDSSNQLSILDNEELVRAVQGVATESTPLRLSSTVRPVKPSRRHKVSDSYRQTAVFYQEPSGDKGFARWVVCIVLGLSLAAFLYSYLSFHLRYQFIVAMVVSSVASPLVAVICLVSKRVRCCGALAMPSVFTSHTGRFGFLLMMTGILLCGPVTNICLNLREISRSFSCGIDQSYNQTMLMTNPYKALVGQLNLTMVSLQEAVVRAEDDLKPLEEKLRQLNHGIHNGLLQLFGSQKVSA